MALILVAITMTTLPPFELKDGDRVVWIGGAVAEREQKYGHWETALRLQWPDRSITFRNLGWSGDTVEGIARASFDPPAKGYERLLKSVKDQKPTVIFVSYGSAEALSGMTNFDAVLGKLVEDLASTKARIVLFTPTPLENTDDAQKARLAAVAQSILNYRDKGYHVADLHGALSDHGRRKEGYTFTDNGLHFSDAGYEGTIPDVMTALGLSWAGESPEKYEAVRKAVVKKNELFFNAWRPQNETYLFGFRKHEQGQNAKEIAEFEKLITDADASINTALKAK